MCSNGSLSLSVSLSLCLSVSLSCLSFLLDCSSFLVHSSPIFLHACARVCSQRTPHHICHQLARVTAPTDCHFGYCCMKAMHDEIQRKSQESSKHQDYLHCLQRPCLHLRQAASALPQRAPSWTHTSEPSSHPATDETAINLTTHAVKCETRTKQRKSQESSKHQDHPHCLQPPCLHLHQAASAPSHRTPLWTHTSAPSSHPATEITQPSVPHPKQLGDNANLAPLTSPRSLSGG